MYAYLSIATVRKVLRYLVENIKYFVGALSSDENLLSICRIFFIKLVNINNCRETLLNFW